MQWGEGWGVPESVNMGSCPRGGGGCKHTERASRGQACVSRQAVGGLVEEEGLTIIILFISYYSLKLPLSSQSALAT